MPERQWIQDHYWDDDGNELPIHPTIGLLLKKFDLDDTTSAIFDPHSKDGEAFEAFAHQYRIPGSHMGRVEQRYLDLYHKYIDMKRQKGRERKAAIKAQKARDNQAMVASVQASKAAISKAEKAAKSNQSRVNASLSTSEQKIIKPTANSEATKSKSATTGLKSTTTQTEPKTVIKQPNTETEKSSAKPEANASSTVPPAKTEPKSVASNSVISMTNSAQSKTKTGLSNQPSSQKLSQVIKPSSVVKSNATSSELVTSTKAPSSVQSVVKNDEASIPKHGHPNAIAPTLKKTSDAAIDTALDNLFDMPGFAKAEPPKSKPTSKESSIPTKSAISPNLSDQERRLAEAINKGQDDNTNSQNQVVNDNDNVDDEVNNDFNTDDLTDVLDVSSTDKQLGQVPIRNLFQKLPEPQVIGFLRVNRKLADEGRVNVELDRNLTEFQRASFTQFLPTPVAQELLNDLSYRDLNATFTMYSACVMGLISKTYFQQWCQGQVFERIKNKPTAYERFKQFKSIQQAIYDSHSETKLSQAVRWYLLMITIEPKGTEAKNNNQQNQQFYELRDLLYTNMGMLNGLLALEDSNDMKNAVYGQPGKQLRGFLHDNHDQLVKPYLTMRNTDIQKNRFKK